MIAAARPAVRPLLSGRPFGSDPRWLVRHAAPCDEPAFVLPAPRYIGGAAPTGETAGRLGFTPREYRAIRRRLDRWELEHLRRHAGELAEQLDAERRARARAEESTEFWREQASVDLLNRYASVNLSAIDELLEARLSKLPPLMTQAEREARETEPDRPLRWYELPRRDLTAAVERCCADASMDAVRAGALFRRELMRALHKQVDERAEGPLDLAALALTLQEAFAAAAFDVPPDGDAPDFMFGFAASLADAIYMPIDGVHELDPLNGDPVAALVHAGICSPDEELPAKRRGGLRPRRVRSERRS